MTPWWTEHTGTWIGTIAGSGVGIIGGLFGGFAGRWVPQGKHKSLMLGSMSVLLGGGLVTLLVGLVALVARQPYAVWYPLVLLGGITSSVMGGLSPQMYKRYRQFDLRRLEAEELRRS